VRRSLLLLLAGCRPGLPLASDGSASCELGGPPPSPCRAATSATLERVVDGDTLDVAVGSDTVRVRLIGIDAPEHDEGDCGNVAQAHLASLAPPGAALGLAFDAECQDRYGRDLAYVTAGDVLLNAAMLYDGYAQPCPFEPNTTYAEAFACLGAQAAARGDGIWALGCNRDACFHRE
jgi:micrococcal nuclease